jgi:hypothetical protein
MPGPAGWGGSNSLLQGLFGSFQAGAAQHTDTASIWTSLRINAANWANRFTPDEGALSDAELEEQGKGILAQAGVNAVTVSTYRGIAGQWLAAKQNLLAADQDTAIAANQIFRPPWAKTADPAVPDRYQLRVQYTITPTIGDAFTKWSTYEVTAPLTTISNILDQANGLVAGDKYLSLLAGDTDPEVSDYELRQI